jgi:omega-amidase
VRVLSSQVAVTADKAANIATATNAVREAAQQGAQLVCLPEMWNTPYDNAFFREYAEDLSGFTGVASPGLNTRGAPSATALARVAAETGVVLVGGSLPEIDSEGRVYNTCLVLDGSGKMLGKHRKVHLFDIDIPGGITFRESETLTQGDAITVVDTPLGIRIGIGICFDIRFPEMAAVACNRGAHMLVYPGAFNTTTGPLHWQLLQQARAVDNLVFCLTCSPARQPGASYQAWGHSTAVGPFAEVLATCDERPCTVFADLDMGELEKRRRAIPLYSQRRGDLYTLTDCGEVKASAKASTC